MQDSLQNCIGKYLKTWFQTKNDLKYEVFHDMSAPPSRIKSKADINNQKTHLNR